MLNKDFVARVVNNLKALTKDGHVSRRFILKTGKTKSAFLISQKLDELSMSRELGIMTTIPCFEMEEILTKDCGVIEFKLCQNIMRSTCELPDLLFSKTGVSVFRVYNIANDYNYSYISPREFSQRGKRKYTIKNKKFFTVKDRRLFLLNSTSELVDIDILTMDKEKAGDMSTCSDKKATLPSVCTSTWDKEFVCPDRFLDIVIKDTLQEVASIYRTSIEDENPNMDSNQKSQTIN